MPAPASGSAAPASCAPAPGTKDAGGKEVNPPGDIPDNQAFVAYSPPTGGYTIRIPEGWSRTEAPRTATFTDKYNSVRVELVDAPAPPTVDSAGASTVPRLAATAPCFRPGKVSTVTRKGGTAVLITYQSDGAPDPVTGKVVRDDVERYEFWRNGTSAVITLTGAAGSDNVDPWKLVTDSFAWR